jgi:predicted RNA-binding protein with EMAP domain
MSGISSYCRDTDLMPGRPFLRAFKAKLKERGGWSAILERRANGETLHAIAKDYDCSRSWLSHQLNDKPELRALHDTAKKEAASALAEQATELVDAAPVERDALTKAKLQAEQRRWLASLYDREQFGEVKADGITVNIGELYISALQERAKVRIVGQVPAGEIVALPVITQEGSA